MKTIAIDGDGVLLDYNTAYSQAWFKAFGEHLILNNPRSYWPMERWNARRLVSDELEQFRSAFDLEFWSTIPAVPGALKACQRLVDQGYTLVCVTALAERFSDARAQNLRALGFPISRVITTSDEIAGGSPKAKAIADLSPVAFVDDYAPYLVGVDPQVHLALILRDPVGSPNTGELLDIPDSSHTDLLGFADWWLSREEPWTGRNGKSPRSVNL
ncbi:MAG: HAD family hydrolase [Hylemonella sp.]|nr:HAD family hydrolase [Hylemonella sp.]MDP1935682.1 HAD family hydrolase [Hylemonella sp.]